jgi:uncharacterized protein YbjT (DUF2867 family)
MRVLVLGAGGFLGRHLMQALAAAGHDARPGRPDWRQAHQPEAWAELLKGMDAAIYLPGTVRDRAAGQTGWLERLHHLAPLALLRAGVPRLIHVSALCGGHSGYALSKQAGDAALLDHARTRGQTLQVVRPSLVLGPGGITSRQLALLARLPWLPLPAAMQRCQLQPLRVEDLAEGLVRLLDAPAAGHPLPAVGAEIATLPDWLARRRAQSGAGPAAISTLAACWARLSARLGDHVSLTSWNRQTLDLMAHDSIEPDPTRTAWLPELLGRPLRSALEGPW